MGSVDETKGNDPRHNWQKSIQSTRQDLSQRRATHAEVMEKWQKTVYHFLAPTGHEGHKHQEMSSKLIWQGFKEKTTAHGIPHVDRAPGMLKKVFWGLLTSATFCLLIYNITMITIAFFNYNVNVKIQILHQNELKFPAVTICNMSPVRKSAWLNRLSEEGEDNVTTESNPSRKKRAVSCSTPSWTAFENVCYFRQNENTDVLQSSAIMKCSFLHPQASLTSIHTAAEQAFITDYVQSQPSPHFWIGLTITGGVYAWNNGDTVTPYRNWAPKEPSIPGDICVRIDKAGLWFAASCGDASAAQGFVCSVNGIPQTIAPTTEATTEPITTEEPTTEAITTTTMKTTQQTTESVVTSTQSTTADQTSEATTEAKTTNIYHETSTADTTSSINDNMGSSTTTPYANPYTTDSSTVMLSGSCCCTCCFPSGGNPDTSCQSCSHSSMYDAAQCAADTPPAWSSAAGSNVTSNNDTTMESKPQPLDGSRFPERVKTRDTFQEQEVLRESLAQIPLHEKADIGYQAASLILDCEYAGSDCYTRNFQSFYNPTHGNCYIFNSGWDRTSDDDIKTSFKAGRRYGLSLVLNIEQDEYMKESGDTAGVRLVVHPQSRMPFPEDEGITVSPGHSTSIGMRKVLISRLGRNYGDCILSEEDQKDKNVYEEMYPVNYSSSACSKTCYQSHVIKRCGCGDAFYPMKGIAFGNKSYEPCRSSDIEQDDCKYEVMRLFNQNKLQCNCATSCTDTEFTLSVSTGQWPSDVQKTTILTKLKPKIEAILSDPTDPNKYKRNLVKLEIYYEQFNFEKISQQAAYTVSSYLSDLGGVLGLWLGCSILTIFEFIEIIMDLAVLVLIRRCSGERDRVQPVSIKQDMHGHANQMPTKSELAKRQSMQLSVMPPFHETTRTPPPRYKSRANLVLDVDEDEKVGRSLRNV